jgi:hypothetical protein
MHWTRSIQTLTQMKVLDDVNQIKDEQVLGLLQQTAKQHADKGDVLFVFVASEGQVPRKMEGI